MLKIGIVHLLHLGRVYKTGTNGLFVHIQSNALLKSYYGIDLNKNGLVFSNELSKGMSSYCKTCSEVIIVPSNCKFRLRLSLCPDDLKLSSDE